jgi:hypothetical protein
VSATHVEGRTYITFPDRFDTFRGPSAQLASVKARRRRARATRFVVRDEAAPADPALAEVGPLAAFDTERHGKKPPDGGRAARFAIVDDTPLPPGTGLAVLIPAAAGRRCFIVEERGTATRALGRACTDERVGSGTFVRQQKEGPVRFHKQKDVVVERFVRWEGPPLSNRLRVGHYLVAVPPSAPATRRSAGLFLHAWGGDASRGYGHWHGADEGVVLLSTNQGPYDWYTAYHERHGEPGQPGKGKAEPYTLRRVLAFVDWATARYALDAERLFVAGSSMGGTGASMFATSAPERFAWARSDVGVHVPRDNPAFRRSFSSVWGKPGADVTTPEGLSPWERYDNAARVRDDPSLNLPLIVFANGVNDENVAFAQAAAFLEALQSARQPHVFTWGQRGHGQRARFMGGARRWPPVALSTATSLPALTRCALDTPLRRRGRWSKKGQVNGWVLWGDVVDEPAAWSTTLWIADGAPKPTTTVDVTPRRVQAFRPAAGATVSFIVTEGAREVLRGQVRADAHGLVTVAAVPVATTRRVLQLTVGGD